MVGGRSPCRRRIVVAAWVGALVSAAPARAERFAYAGAESLPPFEYLDPVAEPAGFNVAPIRALAEHAGDEINQEPSDRGPGIDPADPSAEAGGSGPPAE